MISASRQETSKATENAALRRELAKYKQQIADAPKKAELAKLRAECGRLKAQLIDLEMSTTDRHLTDAQLRNKFAKTPQLRDQFSGPDAYVAYVRHNPKK